MEVVFPEPFTPAIMITNGLAPVTSSLLSRGESSSVITSFKARFSASPSAAFFLLNSAMSACAAATPQSAWSSAVSRCGVLPGAR